MTFVISSLFISGILFIASALDCTPIVQTFQKIMSGQPIDWTGTNCSNNSSSTPPTTTTGGIGDMLSQLGTSLNGGKITIGNKTYQLDKGDYTLSNGKCVPNFPQDQWPYYQNMIGGGKFYLPNSKGCCPAGTSPNPLTGNTLCS